MSAGQFRAVEGIYCSAHCGWEWVVEGENVTEGGHPPPAPPCEYLSWRRSAPCQESREQKTL
eukprot:3203603-Amphidinium_carterae.1